MITIILSGLLAHVPLGIQIFWIYPVYYLAVATAICAGYLQELIGRWKGHGSKLHHLLYDYHTGRYLARRRAYKGEKGFDRGIGLNDRTGPDGRAVFWGNLKRWQRALRNNAIGAALVSAINGLLIDPADTVRATTALVCFLAVMFIIVKTRNKRAILATRSALLPAAAATIVVRPKWTLNKAEREMVKPEKERLKLKIEKPELKSEVPNRILATLLAGEMNCQTEEASRCLTIGKDGGQLRLPDSFPALQRQRDVVQEIIRTHTTGKVAFTWHTTTNPRVLSWVPVMSGLPARALFRDHLAEIQKCPAGTFAIGIQENKTVYRADHNGDLPWHCRSAGSGTGKSTGFLVKAVQIIHNDPIAELYCIDTKQISFEHLKGIPRVHVLDNPQSAMSEIWHVFYNLEGILRDRYTAVREKRNRPEDFHNIWLLVDEGNDLSGNLKTYYHRHIKRSGDPAQPTIWSEAIAPLLRLGRQANIRGEFMLQDITDRALGGESLKAAFSVYGMAGWTKQQWERTIGSGPPPRQTGPGKILMVRGNEQAWVQGFYDDPQYLRDYALNGRNGND